MHDQAPALSALDILLLARLLVPRKSPYRPSDLTKALDRVLGGREGPAQIQRRCADAIARLRDAGLVQDKLQLTEPGRAAILRALGFDTMPRALRWSTLVRGRLSALALGADTDAASLTKVRAADRLPGLVLARSEALATATLPTTTAALDALVWRLLGVESDAPLTRGRLHTFALEQRLGGKSRGDAKQLARRAAAAHLGCARTDADTLRHALLARWLTAKAPGPTGTKPASLPQASLVERALDVAIRGAAPSFGPDLVYIAGLHDALHRADPTTESLEAFKAALLAAHRAGEVTLVRADLVAAMDRDQLDRSEIDDRGTPLHFLRRPEEPRR